MKSIRNNKSIDEEVAEIPPLHRFTLNRRSFFKMLGSGLAVACVVTDPLAHSLDAALLSAQEDDRWIDAWIHIAQDNKITVYTGKVEVGQNIRTSLAQAVAEELSVPIESIEMVMGDTDLTPYDRGTFGSLSTPQMAPRLRKAAASAREVMKEMVAKEWSVPAKDLSTADGEIVHLTTKRKVSYGEVVKGKKLRHEVDEIVTTVPASEWKIAGQSVPKVNGADFVTGKHIYVSDMVMEGMMFGKILRPPGYNAELVSVDYARASSLPGVVVVHEGNFIGVAATDSQLCEKALTIIKADWKVPAQPGRNEIFEYLVSNAEEERVEHRKGDMASGLMSSVVTMEQRFLIDYIAHAPLEPRAAVARWDNGKVTVWAGTQRPFGVKDELMRAFQLKEEQVRVIMPDTGSGYGGKHTGEAALEAARLAKAAGKPVKIVWTREEEFTWAYLRPAGVITIKAGAGKDGSLSAWEHHNYNSGGSGIETPYEVKHQNIVYHPVKSPLRQGSYRGLAGSANVFARESIMDDLARKLNLDPVEFRLKNLKDDRLRDVITAATEAFGWKKTTPAQGFGYGIGCSYEKGGYVATCAEVSVDNGDVKIHRAVTAFECGAIVNPSHLESQILGAVVQGIGGALFEQIDFNEGKILNPSFSSYRVPRFSDMPELKAVMLNRKDLPSAGAGETPIFGIAPAIRNAILAASGKHLYTLPLVPDGLKV